MGDRKVTANYTAQLRRDFTLAVLEDLDAMGVMLREGMFESGVSRIGGEQEVFLVDKTMHPASIVEDVLTVANDPRLTTEIGRFNLEANLTPVEFHGNCFRKLETELNELLGELRKATGLLGAGIVLAGILPTIQRSDLTAGNLTPDPRYFEINRVVSALHGEDRMIHIRGFDEVQLMLHDTFVEFSNTSFQVHLQTDPAEIVNVYNWSQALAAPVLASAVNSPLLLNNRLWHETRIALFQQATDTRSITHQLRRQPPRVDFGIGWIEGSIVDHFRNNVVRYPVVLAQTPDHARDSISELAHGRVPDLGAWRLFNGTIWSWNRVCYGITDGRPGLRIETRYLPSGPSVADEIANAAFLLGLLIAAPRELGDVRAQMQFDAAKHNFYNTARYGLDSQITWLYGERRPAATLILDELLPLARRGLEMTGIDAVDIDRTLGIIEERVRQGKSGAKWMLESVAAMDPAAKQNVRMRTLTKAMKDNQEMGRPVHEWKLAEIPARSDWIDNYKSVEQFMATDLFTVRPDDVLDLAANIMECRHVRHVPVEDESGALVGLISHRDLLRLLGHKTRKDTGEVVVSEVMKTELTTVEPCTPTLDALRLMRERNIGALPVVLEGKLVGLVTSHDFLTVSSRLFEERLNELMPN